MSRTRNLSTVFVSAMILALLVGACAPSATPMPTPKPVIAQPTVLPTPAKPAVPDEIRIGVNELMTGWGAACGDMAWKGDQLAQKDKPTVLGKPVKLIMLDNKSDKAEAAIVAQRLVEVEKVVAVLGTNSSSMSIAQNEVLEGLGIPSIASEATNVLVTQDKKYAFRVCYIDPFQGSAGAKYALEQLGAKKAVLLVDIGLDYPVGCANFFRDAWLQLTGDPKSLLGYFSFQTGDRDFTAQLTAIKALKPDLVYCPNSYNDVAAILVQAKQLGLIPGIQFMDGDSCDLPDFVEIAKDAAEGFVYTSIYHPEAFPNPRLTKFIADYKKEYGQDPTGFAVTAYDAYMLLMDAIERAGSVEPEAVTKALAETKDWEGGLRGKLTIDKNHNAIVPMPVIKVTNGKLVLAGVIAPQ